MEFLKITIDQPGVLSERILITGQSGTGKTATTKRVGKALERIAKNRGLDLIYAHVNCRTTSGKFGLVQAIVRQVAPELPLRGYGSVELLHALWDYLDEHNKLLVLTLDEIDYYIRTTGEDIVYDLTRLTDAVMNVPQRINFMFIARDHSFMHVMSSATLSKFRPRERFDFKPYKEKQIYDILRARVKEAFNENIVKENITRFIARNTATHGYGDARYALQLLLSAGLIADRDGSPIVLPDHVREAQENTDPKLRDEDITLEAAHAPIVSRIVSVWGHREVCRLGEAGYIEAPFAVEDQARRVVPDLPAQEGRGDQRRAAGSQLRRLWIRGVCRVRRGRYQRRVRCNAVCAGRRRMCRETGSDHGCRGGRGSTLPRSCPLFGIAVAEVAAQRVSW